MDCLDRFLWTYQKKEDEMDSHGTPQSCRGLDPCRFWVDFARDPSVPSVQAPVQAFLHKFVENSVKERVVLGPEERAMVRTLNSAYSVIEVWRRLVAAADFKVLRGGRKALRKKEKYLEADRLFLKWEQEGERREGPAYLIVQWILLKLSPALNLEINTLYVKVEATAADIILILLALYQRAEDIPAPPLTRVSFHAAVLLGSTGGFRPGSLMNTKCRQYTLSVVSDPDDRTQTRIIVTPNIGRNKVKTTQMTCKYRKQKSVAYSTTLVPYPVLCLASLVIARAVEMDALAISFESAHDLLHRPVLGKTDRIDIPWKEEFLDKPLFPLAYPVFYELWMRCLLVIGCRKTIRPYAPRTLHSQLTRIAESLSSALRNYVMSHSGAIFENDYQTGVVRPNLAALAYGPKAVRRDETLFNDLRNMSLTRDEGAPISVSKEQISKFRERRDIAKFRDEIQASTDQGEKKRLHRQIRTTIETCIKLQLDADRQAYFKAADRLRLQGLEPEPTPGAGGPGMAAPVAALLSRPGPREDGELLTVGTSVSERYIDAQLLHLSSIALSVPRLVPKAAAASKPQRAPRVPETAAASKPQRDSCCFVCSKGFTTALALRGTSGIPILLTVRLTSLSLVASASALGRQRLSSTARHSGAIPWPHPHTKRQSRCQPSGSSVKFAVDLSSMRGTHGIYEYSPRPHEPD
ncbi:hypothetical protein N657DRAFT_50085 [Parathielavia appendiculata]|uniref:Uncharacterized protein n=1 Tax=Parathielavia appendiculata TaxID=2587402 RepID=A0AAN6UCF5_9PEZI|nr:hypothetical protein N657DRAFT_50085 [Parathielavia appendiculata]